MTRERTMSDRADSGGRASKMGGGVMGKKNKKPRRLATRLVEVKILSRRDERSIRRLIREEDSLQHRIAKLDMEIIDHKRQVESLCRAVFAELARVNLGRIAPEISSLMARAVAPQLKA